jgi:hypothetical protein
LVRVRVSVRVTVRVRVMARVRVRVRVKVMATVRVGVGVRVRVGVGVRAGVRVRGHLVCERAGAVGIEAGARRTPCGEGAVANPRDLVRVGIRGIGEDYG